MIVARINNYEISNKEFDEELKMLLHKTKIEQPNNECRLRALEKLIDGYLLLEGANKSDIIVSEDEIQQHIVDFMLDFNSEADYKKMMQCCGMTEQCIRHRIIERIKIQKYVKTNFKVSNIVSEEKLKEIYEDNLEAFQTKESVRVLHILIEKRKENSKQKIEELSKKISSKQDFLDFMAYAQENETDFSIGDLGYFCRGKMVKNFEDTAFNLSLNDVSHPLETEFGYHLIMVVDIKKPKIAKFEEIKHALRARMEQIESEIMLIRHLKKLRAEADIQIFDDKLYC